MLTTNPFYQAWYLEHKLTASYVILSEVYSSTDQTVEIEKLLIKKNVTINQSVRHISPFTFLQQLLDYLQFYNESTSINEAWGEISIPRKVIRP